MRALRTAEFRVSAPVDHEAAKAFCVYHIHRRGNLSTAEGYIGVTSRSLGRRFRRHTVNTNPILADALRQHSDIDVRQLMVGSDDTCFEMEQLLRPADNIGWNLCTGGGIAPASSKGSVGQRTRQRISESGLGWKRSAENKQRLLSYRLGSKLSLEQRAAIVLRNTGSRRTEATKQLMAEKARSRPRTACPHCGKSVQNHLYIRFHGSNCKTIKKDKSC